jgi:predicted alpha/beta-hydrolase family hydrolase
MDDTMPAGEPHSAAAELLWERPRQPRATLVLAHGAGAPMDSPFMAAMAQRLARRDIAVVRFEFAYMARRRGQGIKAPPDGAPTLLAHFEAVLDAVAAQAAGPVWVGGKSLGGRIASMLAAERALAGCVVFGYPFHPPARPERTRLAHLPALRAPLLICQGERDPFGRPGEVAGYALPARVTLAWISDGDHDLKPRKRSGISWEENLEQAAGRAADFILGHSLFVTQR